MSYVDFLAGGSFKWIHRFVHFHRLCYSMKHKGSGLQSVKEGPARLYHHLTAGGSLLAVLGCCFFIC